MICKEISFCNFCCLLLLCSPFPQNNHNHHTFSRLYGLWKFRMKSCPSDQFFLIATSITLENGKDMRSKEFIHLVYSSLCIFLCIMRIKFSDLLLGCLWHCFPIQFRFDVFFWLSVLVVNDIYHFLRDVLYLELTFVGCVHAICFKKNSG